MGSHCLPGKARRSQTKPLGNLQLAGRRRKRDAAALILQVRGRGQIRPQQATRQIVSLRSSNMVRLLSIKGRQMVKSDNGEVYTKYILECACFWECVQSAFVGWQRRPMEGLNKRILTAPVRNNRLRSSDFPTRMPGTSYLRTRYLAPFPSSRSP